MENMKRCVTCGLDLVAHVSPCPRCGSNQFVPLQLCCPVCNQPLPEGVNSCPHCGTMLAIQQPAIKPCPRCGTPLHANARGCQRCGWSATQQVTPPPKKNASLAWIWLIILVPMLLACIGILGALGGLDALNPMVQNQPTTTLAQPSDPFRPTIPTQSPAWPTQGTSPTQGTTEPTWPSAPVVPDDQQPSQPIVIPTQPVTPPADEDDFPDELKDHVYLAAKGDGYCEEMTGSVMVTVIFLSERDSSWDRDGIDVAKKQINEDLLLLEEEAKSYGAELDLQITYLESTVDFAYDRDDPLDVWAYSALQQHDLEDAFFTQSKLETYYGVDQAPIVYVLNKQGRAYAMSVYSGKATEYAVLFNTGETYPFRHELSHIFGAQDYYYPTEASAAAEQYLTGSVMLESNSGCIDELTAYLIGWTDVLMPNAEAFLRATSHFTEDYLDQEHENETLTGYGTKEFTDGIYTGYMDFGIPHGEGTFVGNNGTTYTGNWKNGVREGYGELTTTTGYSYKGQWVNNLYHGQGTIVYTSGDTYTGEFVEGKFHGKGTYTWTSGNSYTGDWVAGDRHGQGKMTWKDGSYYDGEWANDNMNGYGVRYYASYNTRYEGDFVNGKRHGWGTYYYADGSTYTGRWENDVRMD